MVALAAFFFGLGIGMLIGALDQLRYDKQVLTTSGVLGSDTQPPAGKLDA